MSLNCQFGSRVGPTGATGPTGPVGPLPLGDLYSDYLFFDNATDTWQVGSSSVHLGAGASGSIGSVALGSLSNAAARQSIAIGTDTDTQTGATGSIAIGFASTAEGNSSVAIGSNASVSADNALVLGSNATYSGEGPTGAVVLNGTGDPLTGATFGFTVKPVRYVIGGSVPAGFLPAYYNQTTGEFICFELD